jgi:hypothetical protein
MLLAEINDEWIRWIVGGFIVSILALFRWVALGSKKMSDFDNRLAEASRVGHSAHTKLAVVTPRLDTLERWRAEDRTIIDNLSVKLDEKASEIREDISELRNDLKTLFGGKKG